jgi:hypothetical protein
LAKLFLLHYNLRYTLTLSTGYSTTNGAFGLNAGKGQAYHLNLIALLLWKGGTYAEENQGDARNAV